jgi:hypothetical protein
MKKILLIILLIALLGVVGIILYQKYLTKPQPVEEVLPSGALVYLRVMNLDKHLTDFSQTQLWKALSQIDYTKVLLNFGAPEKEVSQLDMLLQQMSSPAIQMIIKKFFGKEVAVAIYPTALNNLAVQEISKAVGSIVMVTRLGQGIKFVDFFTNVLSQQDKNISVQTKKYKNYDIQVITTKDAKFTFAYVRLKDLFVFGFGEDPARFCVDVVTKQKTPLIRDNQYVLTKAKVINAEELFGYMNFDLFMSFFKSQLLKMIPKTEENAALLQQQLEENLKGFRGFKTIGVSAAVDSLARLKLDVHFDKKMLDPDIRPLYACAPKENKTLAFAPQEVIAYQWSACYDFNYYWQQSQKDLAKIKQLNPNAPDPQASLKAWEQQMGIGVEKDILPVLGDELGGYLEDINAKTIFPIPKLLVFLKITDRTKADQLLTSLVEKNPLFRLEFEEYLGANIRYFSIPLIADLEPAYAVVNDYLLISTQRSAIKAAIDISTALGKGLIANNQIQASKIDLTRPVNSLLWVDVNQLMKKLEELVAWADKWSAAQMAKQKAFVKGSEQRLTDVQKNITEWQANQKSLEEALANLKSQNSEFQPGEATFKKIDDEIAQKEKFIQKINENLSNDRKEEKNLLTIQQSKDMALPPEGEKRLKELQAEIEKKVKKLQELNTEMEVLKYQRETAEANIVRIEQTQKAIEQRRQEIAAAEGTAKELQGMIAQYEAQAGNTQKQRVLVDDLLKPLMGALANIRTITIQVVFGEGILETTTSVMTK